MKVTGHLYLTTLLLFSIFLANAQGIEFAHDIAYQDALDQAKRESKLVFMDCYTSWCGPCKRLAATVFTDSSVGAYFNTNYINTKFDMEKGEGQAIATQYQITAYPTLLWLDGNGTIKKKVVGGLDVTGLISAGKSAADPIPDMLSGMDKKYAAGARDQAFLEEYLKTFKLSGRNYDAILAEYLSQIAKNNWSKESTVKPLFELTNSIHSPALPYLSEYRSNYIKEFGAKEYTAKSLKIAADGVAEAKRKTDPSLLAQSLALVKSSSAPDAKQQAAKMEMNYYLKTTNAATYDRYVTDYIKKYGSTDPTLLNDIAWEYYININDTKYLKKACAWAYKAVNLKNTSTTNTTYAYLQYKLGNYDEATKACDYAIIKSKEDKTPATSALALKEAIKKGKL